MLQHTDLDPSWPSAGWQQENTDEQNALSFFNHQNPSFFGLQQPSTHTYDAPTILLLSGQLNQPGGDIQLIPDTFLSLPNLDYDDTLFGSMEMGHLLDTSSSSNFSPITPSQTIHPSMAQQNIEYKDIYNPTSGGEMSARHSPVDDQLNRHRKNSLRCRWCKWSYKTTLPNQSHQSKSLSPWNDMSHESNDGMGVPKRWVYSTHTRGSESKNSSGGTHAYGQGSRLRTLGL